MKYFLNEMFLKNRSWFGGHFHNVLKKREILKKILVKTHQEPENEQSNIIKYVNFEWNIFWMKCFWKIAADLEAKVGQSPTSTMS